MKRVYWRAYQVSPEASFVERGEAMLELIGQAMGKAIPSGREFFSSALSSVGIEQQLDEFDDPIDEPDVAGEWVYQDPGVAADRIPIDKPGDGVHSQ